MRNLFLRIDFMPLWNDPWIAAAAAPGGTRLPPIRYALPPNITFACEKWTNLSVEVQSAWIALVGTQWSSHIIETRLTDAWIPCLFLYRNLVSTCVIRFRTKPVYILETLTARRGHASTLLRSTVRWLYDMGGAFALTYTWELTTLQLLAAWTRGWMVSAMEIQRGWTWTPPTSSTVCQSVCDFDAHPQHIGQTLVTNSGLNDGVGYIVHCDGNMDVKCDWNQVCALGHWTRLWTRSVTKPKSTTTPWHWTGEWVVIGCLNRDLINTQGHINLQWVTAEVSHGPRVLGGAWECP